MPQHHDLMLVSCIRQAYVDADARYDIAAFALQSIINTIDARCSFLLKPTQKLDMRNCQGLIMHPSEAAIN